MKKIYIIIFILISLGLRSQTINQTPHVKVTSTDSIDVQFNGLPKVTFTKSGKVGIGTTSPTSLLHLNQNGLSKTLLKLSNDKNTAKDSTILFLADGSCIIGDSSYLKIGTNYSVSNANLTLIGGVPLRLLNKNNIGYTSLKWSGKTHLDTIADYAQVVGGIEDSTYGANKGYFAIYTASGTSNGLVDFSRYLLYDHAGTLFVGDSSSDVTTIKPKYIGINTKSPTFNLHVDGNSHIGNTSQYTEISAAYGIVINDMTIIKDSAMFPNRATTLSDEEVYSMPTAMAWDLQISVDSAGKKLTSFHVVCDDDGTVMLGQELKRWSSVTYLATSSASDGYFCVYDAGTGMAIKNRLGYTVEVTIIGAAKL